MSFVLDEGKRKGRRKVRKIWLRPFSSLLLSFLLLSLSSCSGSPTHQSGAEVEAMEKEEFFSEIGGFSHSFVSCEWVKHLVKTHGFLSPWKRK